MINLLEKLTFKLLFIVANAPKSLFYKVVIVVLAENHIFFSYYSFVRSEINIKFKTPEEIYLYHGLYLGSLKIINIYLKYFVVRKKSYLQRITLIERWIH